MTEELKWSKARQQVKFDSYVFSIRVIGVQHFISYIMAVNFFFGMRNRRNQPVRQVHVSKKLYLLKLLQCRPHDKRESNSQF